MTCYRCAALLAVLIMLTACSSPRPVSRMDAIKTGDATAKDASDAARKAEEESNTGLIVSSSQREEPASQPIEPAKAEASDDAESSVLEVEVINGDLVIAGTVIADFPKVAAAAVANDPNVVLQIRSTEQITPARLSEIEAQAKTAGMQRITVTVVRALDETPDEDQATPEP